MIPQFEEKNQAHPIIQRCEIDFFQRLPANNGFRQPSRAQTAGTSVLHMLAVHTSLHLVTAQ